MERPDKMNMEIVKPAAMVGVVASVRANADYEGDVRTHPSNDRCEFRSVSRCVVVGSGTGICSGDRPAVGHCQPTNRQRTDSGQFHRGDLRSALVGLVCEGKSAFQSFSPAHSVCHHRDGCGLCACRGVDIRSERNEYRDKSGGAHG